MVGYERVEPAFAGCRTQVGGFLSSEPMISIVGDEVCLFATERLNVH